MQTTGSFTSGRISYVELTTEPVTGEHTQAVPDAFGWTGDRWYNVKLELTSRAQQLLLEDCPSVRPYVAKPGSAVSSLPI